MLTRGKLGEECTGILRTIFATLLSLKLTQNLKNKIVLTVKRNSQGPCYVLKERNEPSLVKVPWVTESQLPQLARTASQGSNGCLRASQD